MFARRLVPIVAACLVTALAFVGTASAWSWPLRGAMLRAFSFGDDPYAGGQHRGIDVGGAPGEPVLAPTSGTVSYVGTVPTNGRTVTILTSDGYAVTLTHLGETSVSKGALVAEGEPVGSAGTSGTPEYPDAYVHLGIRTASEPEGYLDPLRFLPVRPVSRPTAPAPVGEPSPVAAPALAPAPTPADPPTATAPAPPPAPDAPAAAEQPSAAAGALVPVTVTASPASPMYPPVAPVPASPATPMSPPQESAAPSPGNAPVAVVQQSSPSAASAGAPPPRAAVEHPWPVAEPAPVAPDAEPPVGALRRDARVAPASPPAVDRGGLSSAELSAPPWVAVVPTAGEPLRRARNSGSVHGSGGMPDHSVTLRDPSGSVPAGRGGSAAKLVITPSAEVSVPRRPTRPRVAERVIALVELGDRSDGLGAFRGSALLAGLGLLLATAMAVARGVRRIDRHGSSHRLDPLLGSTLGSAG